eukprot:scaffold2584_cov113-Isochrysis_galbana.AAC.5
MRRREQPHQRSRLHPAGKLGHAIRHQSECLSRLSRCDRLKRSAGAAGRACGSVCRAQHPPLQRRAEAAPQQPCDLSVRLASRKRRAELSQPGARDQ